jgi:hypothetical protein
MRLKILFRVEPVSRERVSVEVEVGEGPGENVGRNLPPSLDGFGTVLVVSVVEV